MDAGKKKAPEACQGFEGNVSNLSNQQRNRTMTSIQHNTDARTNRAVTPEAVLIGLAVVLGLVVLLADSGLVTALAEFLVFATVARMRVVDRRRARRAAHRATREALLLANSAHAQRELEAVAA